MCGIGVMSLMRVTAMPEVAIARTADSRPAPAPWTRISTSCMPLATALRAHSCATIVPAKAVDLRDPLNPALPEELHAMTLPRATP